MQDERVPIIVKPVMPDDVVLIEDSADDVPPPLAPQPTIVTKKKRATKIQKAKPKKLLIPFHQQIGRYFVTATPDCLSLAVSETNHWKRLEAYCRDHANLDCPILPAFLGKSLKDIKFIINKNHFHGDTNFDRMKQDGLL